MKGIHKQKFTEEQWEEIIKTAYDCYIRGMTPSRIKKKLLEEHNVLWNQWKYVNERVCKKLKENTDVYNEHSKELQISRLQELLDDVIEQGDAQMALKVIAELNKLLALYEQKMKVTIDEYKINL